MINLEGSIRPLKAEDLLRVVEIDEENTGRSRLNFLEKRVGAAMEKPKSFIYIAYEFNSSVEGYLLARLQKGEFGASTTVAVIDDIGVGREFQGRGIGHRLMAELSTILNNKQINEIRSQADWSDQGMLHYFASVGFKLAPRYIYERDAAYLDTEAVVEVDEVEEIDYSDPSGDDSLALSRDKVPCRSLTKSDFSAMVKIDKKITGHDRSSYLESRIEEVLKETGVRVSLVAEQDDHVVGFIMARVDFGEFGRTEPAAIIDTLGVDPGYAHKNVGSALLSQLMANLAVLRTDTVRTEVGAKQLALLGFLQNNGFVPAQSLSLTRAV